MPSITEYRKQLRSLAEWESYLLAHSGLPGPRGNLELAHAVALEGDGGQFHRWSSSTPEAAPENTPEVFLAFCGVLGLGRLLALGSIDGAAGDLAILRRLRTLASDPRWRIREAVATALQLWGDADMPALIAEMTSWAAGNCTEQRAVAAALCEPRLLADPGRASAVLNLLDIITANLAAVPAAGRKSESFRILRQALGYCWSVAVAACPDAGLPALQRWLAHPDLDVRWGMRENLRKKRLAAFNLTLPE